jgi:hypothetical protein
LHASLPAAASQLCNAGKVFQRETTAIALHGGNMRINIWQKNPMDKSSPLLSNLIVIEKFSSSTHWA